LRVIVPKPGEKRKTVGGIVLQPYDITHLIRKFGRVMSIYFRRSALKKIPIAKKMQKNIDMAETIYYKKNIGIRGIYFIFNFRIRMYGKICSRKADDKKSTVSVS